MSPKVYNAQSRLLDSVSMVSWPKLHNEKINLAKKYRGKKNNNNDCNDINYPNEQNNNNIIIGNNSSNNKNNNTSTTTI